MKYEELMEEIRDVYLDPCELQVRASETSDGSGKRYVDYEFESTAAQDIKVQRLILEHFYAWLNTITDRVFEKHDK